MKLPFFPKKENKDYILAVLLRDEKITVVIFEELDNKITVASQNSTVLPSSVEDATFEDLLEALDTTISTAEEMLPEGSNVEKTVFGVKEQWTEEAKIKKEYLVILKKLSEELDLKPIGFLVFAEAIAHLLQQEEGAPVSAILVEAGKKNATVSLLRAGRITETYQGAIEHSLTKTVDTLLKHFASVEILPSRIILFDQDNNEKVTQAFIGHSWSKGLPFLHVPQVTVLPKGFDSKAVLHGTAVQLGLTALDDTKGKGVFLQSTHKRIEVPEEDAEEKEPQQKHDEVHKTDAEAFGFAIDKDVAKPLSETAQTKPLEEKPAAPQHLKINKPSDNIAEEIEEIPEEVKEQTTGEAVHKESLPGDSSLLFSSIKKIPSLFFKKKASPKVILEKEAIPQHNKIMPPSSSPRKKLLYFLPLPALILLGMLLFYIFELKATVTLFVTPKILEQNQDLTFSTKASNDFPQNTIAAETAVFSEEDSQTTNATGKKETGDSAKGTVTIYNKLTDPVNLAKGTTIASANGLKFTLDQSVTVASASGASDPTAPTTPGTAKVSVTATTFGTDYNLPSNTKFSVGTNGATAAKNDTAFSGGTKKEITVVAKEDLDKLTDDLTKNLEKKAKDEMEKSSPSDKTALPLFIKTDVKKKDFDKKVGDEAKNITLHMNISFQALSYNKQQLSSYAESVITRKVPSDATLVKDGISYDIKDLKQKNDTDAQATLAIKAKTLLKLNTQTIAAAVKGKSFEEASSILGKQPQFARVTFALSPNLFFLPKILPRNTNNIKIVVKNND